MTTQTAKFEARFSGVANKSLRARIRRPANSLPSCPSRAAAIRKLNVSDKATLELVARDYDPIQ